MLLLLPRWGYATPFAMPDQFSWHGRDYMAPTGCTTPYARDRPLRQVGAVHGILTSSKPVYVGASMPKGLDPVYLYVRSGGCLHAYDLSGGP